MRLIGYAKELKCNYFAKPIYSENEEEYFFHEVDESYTIIGFSKIIFKLKSLKKVYLSKEFEIGSKGAIVFIGNKNYIKYDVANLAIDEVINFINDNTSQLESYTSILNQSLKLKKSIFSDSNKKPVKESSLVLKFDFPNILKKESKFDAVNDNSKSSTHPHLKKLQTVERNFEIALRARADFRRSKLKMYNYQFKSK
jgi:hypothetical protein